MTLRSALASAIALTLLGATPALAASSSSSSASSIQSCTRLEADAKAKCLWENQKLYKAMAAADAKKKKKPTTTKTVTLPSCGRIKDGKARSACLVNNRKLMMAGSSSSKSKKKTTVTNADVCAGLVGEALTLCKKESQSGK